MKAFLNIVTIFLCFSSISSQDLQAYLGEWVQIWQDSWANYTGCCIPLTITVTVNQQNTSNVDINYEFAGGYPQQNSYCQSANITGSSFISTNIPGSGSSGNLDLEDGFYSFYFDEESLELEFITNSTYYCRATLQPSSAVSTLSQYISTFSGLNFTNLTFFLASYMGSQSGLTDCCVPEQLMMSFEENGEMNLTLTFSENANTNLLCIGNNISHNTSQLLYPASSQLDSTTTLWESSLKRISTTVVILQIPGNTVNLQSLGNLFSCDVDMSLPYIPPTPTLSSGKLASCFALGFISLIFAYFL